MAHLLWRPALRRRGDCAYLTVRSWRAETRAEDLAAFKREKRAKGEGLVDLAAAEIAHELRALLCPTPDWSVTAVAPGHSREARSWGVLLAAAVAEQLQLTFRTAFQPRPVAGSSHPRRNLTLPALEWQERPRGPVVLVDDVATSGWHLAEALGLLRQAGVAAIGAAWISGTVRAPHVLPAVPSAASSRAVVLPPAWSAGTAD